MGALRNLLCRFGRDERGVALILVSIMLPVIIGFALLAFDMSRANNLHNDLQKGADGFAIAAAYELDGRSDSIERADRAIANLVDNTYRFSDAGAQQVLATAGISRRYLTNLPTNDSDPISASMVVADELNFAHEAQFVEITVTPVGFQAIFPASFLTANAADNAFNVGATSVAGNAGAIVCEMTPIFICNPFPGESFHEVVNDESLYRKSIRMVPGESWAPGNFGFLRPQSDHGYGEGDLARDLARGSLPECVSRRRVYTQTGTLTTMAIAGFNTRFDMYHQGGGFPSRTDASWPPAPNIRKGFQYSPQGANPGSDPCRMELATDTTQFRPLTRDTSFTGLIGNGQWDYEGYLAANGFSSGDMANFTDEDGNPYSNANPPSRYELYKYELDEGLVDDPSLGGEVGTPACHSNVGDIDRRMIYAAILDCDDPAVRDQLNGQSGAPPAVGFASFFLTEAVTGNEVLAEIVDIDGVQGRGTMANFVREDVQLYR
jgi:Flp pilus assembly protein TadG